jgi:phosphonopyruvate decarboxylase
MMKRDECFKLLAEHLAPDVIVVAAYSSAFDWIAVRPSPLNYIFTGAMGLASSHALGLALGRPDRKVVVLDGDGSLLMNLGSLVTIANMNPSNLIHFVCENGTYEANGGHPTPGRDRISFAGFARSAGYDNTHEFSQLADFSRRIGVVLQESGPVFVDLKVEQGVPAEMDYALMHGAAIRRDFAAALKADRE